MSLTPDKIIVDKTIDSTAVVTSDIFEGHPAAVQTSLLISSDQALTVDIQDRIGGPNSGTWHTIDPGVAVTANVALPIAYAYGFNAVRVLITPGASPAVVKIEARYRGHGGSAA